MAVMALVPPPPGVTANFVNPEQGGKHVVVLGLVGIPISTLFLAMRLYTKARINRSFGSEDGIEHPGSIRAPKLAKSVNSVHLLRMGTTKDFVRPASRTLLADAGKPLVFFRRGANHHD